MGRLRSISCPHLKNSSSHTRGDLVQWCCNLNRAMQTSQSPTRTRPMCRERRRRTPRQGGGENRRVRERRVVGGEVASLPGGGRCHLNARSLPQRGREAKGAARFDELCPLRSSAPLRQTRTSGKLTHSRGSDSGAVVWGGLLAESGSVLTLSARAIPDQARVFAIFGCQAPGRAGVFAISFCEVTGRAKNFAISFCEVAGRAGNFAISFCEVAERARNFAISFCEVAGRVRNFAISFCEVAGRAGNFAISFCEVAERARNFAISFCEATGRAGNFAISFCEVAGRAKNFAISFCEGAQRTGQAALVPEIRPGRKMNLKDRAGMILRWDDRLADLRRMPHAAVFHGKTERRSRHALLILLGAGGFITVSLCQHHNP
jgi:hypothetical protein